MHKLPPQRPMAGGTNDGARPRRYEYWRVGYGESESFALDFWVERAGEYHCKPGYVTGSLDHPNSTQVFYHLAGKATFEYGRRTVPVARGDILIIPYDDACTYSSRQGLQYHWFGLGRGWPAIWGTPPQARLLSPGYDLEIENKFTEIRETLILRKPGYPVKAVSIFYDLLARVEELKRERPAPTSAYPEAVRSAIIFLRETYTTPFDATRTAAAVSLSQSHLRALFEKWVGESPHQFHTRCRIDQAKRLLLEQRLPVTEVALQVGFNDPRYFSRVFKQVTGLAPSRYAA